MFTPIVCENQLCVCVFAQTHSVHFPGSVLLGSCLPKGGVISKGSALCLSLEQLFDFINY